MRSDNTVRFLLEQRNISLKQRPIQPHGNTTIAITEHLAISDSWVITVHHADGTQEKFESQPEPPPPYKPTEVTMRQSWYFNELSQEKNNVVVICEEHIAKLEKLVSECEARFNSALE